ncbi:hypothetical protein NKH77_11275 [Streptomyces sp. M19]
MTDEHQQADKWALHALDLLGPLRRWRTLAMMAGSFPASLPKTPTTRWTKRPASTGTAGTWCGTRGARTPDR